MERMTEKVIRIEGIDPAELYGVAGSNIDRIGGKFPKLKMVARGSSIKVTGEAGEIERFGAHAVVMATGGYGNVFFLSTNAMNSNGSAAWQCYKKGAVFANPCFTQIHPTCIPVHGTQQSKLTLMSESLRNDGRIWVPKKKEDVEKLRAKKIKPSQIPEEDRDYYLERRYPAFGNLVPRDVASRAAKERCDAGFGVNETGLASTSRPRSRVWASRRSANATATCSRCTRRSPT